MIITFDQMLDLVADVPYQKGAKITQFLIIDHLLQLYADHQFDQNYY